MEAGFSKILKGGIFLMTAPGSFATEYTPLLLEICVLIIFTYPYKLSCNTFVLSIIIKYHSR